MSQVSSVLSNVPAHLQNQQRFNLNASASQNLSAPFSVLSIKGKVWRIKHRGIETILQTSAGTDHQGRPLPVQPVQTIDVVVVGLASGVSKTYYPGQYVEGSMDKPDCMSANGVTPDVGVPNRQSAYCGPCPQNQWGSRTTAQGKRAKACQDARRLAVVPAGNEANEDFGGAMLFRIPAMSLVALDKYCRDLERMNVDISQVVTRLGFEPSMAYPSITFTAAGWVQSAEAYAIVAEHVQSEAVNRIINESGLEPTPTIDQPSPGMAALTATPRPTFAPMQPAAPAIPPPVQQAAPPPPPVQQAPAPSPFRQAAQPAPQPQQPPQPPPQPQQRRRRSHRRRSSRRPSRRHSSGLSRCRLRSVRRGPELAAGRAAAPAQPARPAPSNGAGPVVTGAPEDLAATIDGLLSN